MGSLYYRAENSDSWKFICVNWKKKMFIKLTVSRLIQFLRKFDPKINKYPLQLAFMVFVAQWWSVYFSLN